MTHAESSPNMSIGTGIAVAGVWVGASAVSVFIMLIVFVWPQGDVILTGDSVFMIILFVAAPMIAAYSVTKLILNRDYPGHKA